MSGENLWLKELSDFFLKDENWSTACKTTDAVGEVENYWKELFWGNVRNIIESQLGEKANLWEYEVIDGNEVCLYPIAKSGVVRRTCSIGVLADEDDGGYFSVWVDADEYSFGTKSLNYKLVQEIMSVGESSYDNEGHFYQSNVVPGLYEKLENRSSLIDLIKDSRDASKLANKVLSFINQTDIHAVLLKLK